MLERRTLDEALAVADAINLHSDVADGDPTLFPNPKRAGEMTVDTELYLSPTIQATASELLHHPEAGQIPPRSDGSQIMNGVGING